jgi:hypothetical protein
MVPAGAAAVVVREATSGYVLRTSPDEDRAGALRARAHWRQSEGNRSGKGERRRGEAAPSAKGVRE